MFLDKLLQILSMDGVPDARKLASAQREAQEIALIEQGLELKRLQALHERYVGFRLPRKGLQASGELEFDLGTARDNEVIDNKGGRIIFITECTGTAKFRFDGIARDTYTVRVGAMPVPFEKLYLTNEAQAGKKLTLIIGQDPSVSFITDPVTDLLKNIPKKSTIPTIESVYMSAIDTEYSYTFPEGTKRFSVEINGGGLQFRVSWVTGKVATPVAPYLLMQQDAKFQEWGIDLTDKTLYFAVPEAPKTMVILSYT